VTHPNPWWRLAAALTAVAVLVGGAGSSAGGSDGAAAGQNHWVGAWAAAPTDAGGSFSNQTLRLNLTPLHSGDVARVRLSNRFGSQAITFTSVRLGKQRSGATLVAGSNRRVRFDRREQVVVPAGAEVVSDPVRLSFQPFEHLAVSVYVPGDTGPATRHAQAKQRSFVTDAGAGDHSAAESGAAFRRVIKDQGLDGTSRPFVTGIDVSSSGNDGVVVAIGDSLTDGDQRPHDGSEGGIDADARYPDYLARRLQHRTTDRRLSVVNLGIGGNRVLQDGFIPQAGPSLLRRIPTDVLARRDVTDVILMEGTNDINISEGVTPEDVIAGLRAAVRKLRTSRPGCPGRINVLVGTIPPAGGAGVGGDPKVARFRDRLNTYIRTSGIGDGVVDFNRALRDPRHPDRLAPAYDSGDHLHPSSAGYKRMAREVDLGQLRGRQCATR
jgi:lysophospholipase L1-like esterase